MQAFLLALVVFDIDAGPLEPLLGRQIQRLRERDLSPARFTL
jgi:hypothetical protein